MQEEGQELTEGIVYRCSKVDVCSQSFALVQLGTHLRAKKKREEMGNLLRKAKK